MDWISVKDRLPPIEYEDYGDGFMVPKNTHYLVYIKAPHLAKYDLFQLAFRTEYYNYNRLGEFHPEQYQWWLIGMERNIPETEFCRITKKCPRIEITHWMNLPEPPNENI